MSEQTVVDKIDELLKDDTNFETRSGLRFMTELLKDAFKYIDKANAVLETHSQDTIQLKDRVKGVEKTLDDFLEARAKEKEAEQKEADHQEAERTRWRWAIVGPSIALLIGEVAFAIGWVIKLIIAAAAGH